jgi:prepilin-type N-terminal cleavage/methylation domain-containing protein
MMPTYLRTSSGIATPSGASSVPVPDSASPLALRARGFTFIELIIVMGVIALVAGLGIGFLQNIGRASAAFQAASILAEAGFECKNRSIGGRTSTLVVTVDPDENDNDRILVTQAVQRPILTAHFEDANWFVNAAGPTAARSEGVVSIDPDGKSGSAVALGRGGRIDFGTQAAFAPTDGVEIGAWVKPAAGGGAMMVVRGEDAYELYLTREGSLGAGSPDAYKVFLRVKVVDAAEVGRTTPTSAQWTSFETATAPVLGGRWTEIVASFDGVRGSLRVDGVERVKDDGAAGAGKSRTPAGAAPPAGSPAPGLAWRRFPAQPSGGVHLTLSAPDRPFVGSVDTLFVQGIFRSDADRRTLPAGLRIERPKLPLVVRFHNGRLDPRAHRSDVNVVLEDEADREGGRYLVRFGLYGLVSPPRTLLLHEDPDAVPAKPTTSQTTTRPPG